MSNSKLGKRYAEALYEAAVDAKNIDDVIEAMKVLMVAFKDPALVQFWLGPNITLENKLKVVDTALDSAPEIVRSFLRVLLMKKRGEILSDVFPALQEIHDCEENIVRATLVTAIKLQEAEVEPFRMMLSDQVGGNLILKCDVDPSIISGFKLRYGDKVIDASVLRSIEALRRRACA